SSLFFFFSSRRRHTRCLSDWSSDVSLPISLDARSPPLPRHSRRRVPPADRPTAAEADGRAPGAGGQPAGGGGGRDVRRDLRDDRSEERRVGKGRGGRAAGGRGDKRRGGCGG